MMQDSWSTNQQHVPGVIVLLLQGPAQPRPGQIWDAQAALVIHEDACRMWHRHDHLRSQPFLTFLAASALAMP